MRGAHRRSIRRRLQAISRARSFLLLNNILLVAAAGLILVGTVYPLFLEALDVGRISVGPPYFDTAFLIPMLPLLFLLAVGMHASWKRARLENVKVQLLIALAVAVVVGIAFPWSSTARPAIMTVLGMAARPLGHRVAASSIRFAPQGAGIACHRRCWACASRISASGSSSSASPASSRTRSSAIWLKPGESARSLAMTSGSKCAGPARPELRCGRGEVTVLKDGETVTVLHPQKRLYRVQTNPNDRGGHRCGLVRDLFVALG